MMWLELLLSLYKVCQLRTFKKAFEVRPTTWKSLYVFIHTSEKSGGKIPREMVHSKGQIFPFNELKITPVNKSCLPMSQVSKIQ